ncbi:lysophospholipid acyltransferase family protein [Endothiovibrio diazotrophicus]
MRRIPSIHWPKILLFALLIRPLVWLLLGVHVRHPRRLPRNGPAILAANHNSHLDALVIMALYPLRELPRLRPVAAGDYFFRTPLAAWCARHLLGAIPLERRPRHHTRPLGEASEALERGEILILFPEGSRGEPEQPAPLRSGVAHLARAHPQVSLTSLFLYGLGKALPRGEALFVPFFCDLYVGEPIRWEGARDDFLSRLSATFSALREEASVVPWE